MEQEAFTFPIYSMDGSSYYYKVKTSTLVSRVIKSYTQRIGIREDDITLYVDGCPILDLDSPCEIFIGASRVVAGPPFQEDIKEPCEM